MYQKNWIIIIASCLVALSCTKWRGINDPIKDQDLGQKPQPEIKTVCDINKDMIGVWLTKTESFRKQTSEYTDNSPRATLSTVVVEIKDDCSLTYSYAGVSAKSGTEINEVSATIGSLQKSGETEAKLVTSDEWNEKSRKNGASEQSLKDAQSAPPMFRLSDSNTLERISGSGKPTTVYVRTTNDELATIKANQKKITGTFGTFRTMLQNMLGEKTFIVDSYALTAYNGDGTLRWENIVRAEEMPELVSNDIPVLKISFSSDVGRAKINDETDAAVELWLTKDLTAPIISIEREAGQTKLEGRLTMNDNKSLSFVKDETIKGQRQVLTTTYKLVE